MAPNDQEREKWDRLYASLEPQAEEETIRVFNQEFSREILTLLPEGGKTIEIGSGGGWQSLALARTGKFDVTLLDFSGEALAYSQKLFAREGLSARFIQEDGFSHGRPEYDLAFNAGVLEHYTFGEQVGLVKAMATRSRRYVLILLPNRYCYWYWLWRNQIVERNEWSFGKEVPLGGLSKIFQAAGLTFVGQSFLGHAWTENFIAGLQGIDESVRREIIQTHRAGLLLPESTGYLVAGLGMVPGFEPLEKPRWGDSGRSESQTIAELSAALADALAVQIQAKKELHSQIQKGTQQFEQLNSQKLELEHLLKNSEFQSANLQQRNNELRQANLVLNNELGEIKSSRGWRLVQTLWKTRLALFPPNSIQNRIAIATVRKIRRGRHAPQKPATGRPAKGRRVPEFIEQHLTSPSSSRVLLVTKIFFDPMGNDMQFGGAERYLLELAELVRSLNYEPLIVQCGNEYWMRYYHDVPVIGVKVGTDYDALTSELENLAPRGALAIYSPFELASARLGIPSVGISHGIYWDDQNLQQSPERLMRLFNQLSGKINNLNALVSVDTNTINWLRTVDCTAAQKGVYIPNFVDLDQFVSTAAEKETQKIVILFPRRLVIQRGFWLVHQILPAILEKYPNVEFHFVGKAAPREQEAVNELLLSFPGRVQWYFLPPEEMHTVYQKADITIIPTVQSEGTSLSCLEALAAGNAVIATNVGGLPDLILHEYNGLLIQPDARDLQKAIEELIENPSLRQKLAQNGKEVAQSFTIVQWKQQWKNVLTRLLPERPPASAPETRRFLIFPFGYGIHWQGVQQRPHHLAVQYLKNGYEVYWYTPEGRLPDPLPNLHLLARNDELYLDRPVLFIYYPQSYVDAERFGNPIVVYDILDDISIHDTSGNDAAARQARECHEELLKKADIVITSSRLLLEQIQPRRPDVLYVPNAVDVDHFDPRRYAGEKDQRTGGRPVIGYHGAIASWFDGELMAKVAGLRPDYQFVMVGPVSDPVVESALKSRPNIRLLGAIPYENLPAHIARFDVGIMPFTISPLTHAVRPLKILEYLSMQKPVVATPMQEILDWPGVRIAGSAEEFAGKIDEALEAGFVDDGSIQRFVQASTWRDVIRPLLERINEVYARTAGPR